MRKFKLTIPLLLFTFLSLAQENEVYYDNGNIKYQENRKNDILKSKIWWHDNGQKSSQTRYDTNGVLVGIKKWNENGKLTSNENFKKQQKKTGKTDLTKIKWIQSEGIGLSYENQGIGDLPKTGDSIELRYIGYFENGEQFDNSIKDNRTLIIVVGENKILGSFSNTIAKLKKNQKAYIRIPPELGYGDKPYGNIPPNSTLIYFVEIVEIN